MFCLICRIFKIPFLYIIITKYYNYKENISAKSTDHRLTMLNDQIYRLYNKLSILSEVDGIKVGI